jgi:hypothetical protein
VKIDKRIGEEEAEIKGAIDAPLTIRTKASDGSFAVYTATHSQLGWLLEREAAPLRYHASFDAAVLAARADHAFRAYGSADGRDLVAWDVSGAVRVETRLLAEAEERLTDLGARQADEEELARGHGFRAGVRGRGQRFEDGEPTPGDEDRIEAYRLFQAHQEAWLRSWRAGVEARATAGEKR